eukprot:CAMPEP_0174763262 /NCGR_PEP_ID=MMETSP1094-20130205/110193_1 /TAXON_ID=156173 /ORGANISM="Chrysochromulina brevifilum, Strain UTEX LB 985" /LENGTH=102 /DNA_ID=CAMNT_0015969219 /DNA_START=76 /DNA_END=384 /DNA_ORIENTATION=-
MEASAELQQAPRGTWVDVGACITCGGWGSCCVVAAIRVLAPIFCELPADFSAIGAGRTSGRFMRILRPLCSWPRSSAPCVTGIEHDRDSKRNAGACTSSARL